MEESGKMGNNYDFCSSVRFSLPWNSLKYKYENKIQTSEFYFYQTLVDETSSLALALKLDYKLCEALSYVHGFAFCDYGKAGWKVIEKYLKDNEIDVSINQIKTDIVKRKIKSVRKQPSDDFISYVEEKFSSTVKTQEVMLVNECYRILKTLQPLKNADLNLFFEIEEKAIKELKENIINNNDYNVNLDKYILSDIPKLEDLLDEKTQEELYGIILKEHKLFIEKYPNLSDYENLLAAISCFVDN